MGSDATMRTRSAFRAGDSSKRMGFRAVLFCERENEDVSEIRDEEKKEKRSDEARSSGDQGEKMFCHCARPTRNGIFLQTEALHAREDCL